MAQEKPSGRRSGPGRGSVSAKRAAERRTTKAPVAPSRRFTPRAAAQPAPAPTGPPPSARYTPPVPLEFRSSPRWVPILMFTLLIAGVLVVVTNYLGVLPTESGEASNWYLLLGLGLITGGFITATQYR